MNRVNQLQAMGCCYPQCYPQEGGLVGQAGARWNRILLWLRRLEGCALDRTSDPADRLGSNRSDAFPHPALLLGTTSGANAPKRNS